MANTEGLPKAHEWVTKFAPGDKVKVTALARPGLVLGIFIGLQHVQYQVRYFYEGNACNEYFMEDELEENNKA